MILQMATNDGNTTVRCSSTACVGGDRDPDHRITIREKLLRNTSFSITPNLISITMIIKLKLTLLTALHYRRSIYTWQCSYHQHHLEIMSIIPFTILQSNRSFYTRQLDNIYNIDRIQTLQDKQFHKTVLIFVSHFATSMIYTQTKTKWRILCFHRFANTQMLWIITGLQIHCIIFMAGDH